MIDLEEDFLPFKMFMNNIHKINEFEELSDISFGLSQQLLFKYGRDEFPKIEFGVNDAMELLNKSSYGPADFKIKTIDVPCKWLTIEDYAKKKGTTVSVIRQELDENQLGTTSIDPTTKEILIIWPTEYQSKKLEELPAPGKYKVSVTLSLSVPNELPEDVKDLDNFDIIQKKFLALAHSIGDPENVNKNAKNTLYRSCFLLYWSSFEVYIRSVFDYVIEQNPEILFNDKQSEKLTISYKELYTYSNKLASIQSLQSKIIENEISKQEGDGRSVHGIINFLKSKMHFTTDPYITWYKIRGDSKVTSFQDLLEIKIVRNALMHDGGFPDPSFFVNYPNVPCENSEIVINSDYYLKSVLILRSIAYNLAELLVKKEYKINDR